MKNILPLLLIAILFFNTCNENEPTTPEEEKPTGELLAESTIGPEGGILETEEFKLTIPNGAFLSNFDLKLSVHSEEEAFGEYNCSKLFRIDGLPGNPQVPLHINLKYSGDLTENSFIAVGIEDSVTLIDSSFVDFIYNLYEAELNEGFLNCEILGTLDNSMLKTNAESNKSTLIGGISNCKNETVSEHFQVLGTIPESSTEENEIVNLFEKAYTRFKDAGFNYQEVKNPIKIIFTDWKDYPYPSYLRIYRNPHQNFIINVKYHNTLDITKEIKRQIVSEFLEIILKAHSGFLLNKGFERWATFEYGYGTWNLKRAIANITRGFWYSDPALFWEFIERKYGVKKLAQLCYELSSPMYLSFVFSLGRPYEEPWLSEFYKYLFTDMNFESVESGWFYGYNEHIVNNTFTTQLIEKSNIPQSVSSHFLKLDNDLGENTSLIFSSNIEESDILLFKTKNKNREFIGEKKKIFTLSGIKSLSEQGYDLLALIINYYVPYSPQDNMKFTIEKTESVIPTRCTVNLRNLTANFQKEYPRGTYTTEEDRSLGLGFPIEKPDPEVTFTNNTFTQKYTNYQFSDGYYYSQDITIVFGDKELSYISSLSAKWERAKILGSTINYRKNEMSAVVIDRDKSVDYIRFRIGGEDVCAEKTNLSLYKFIDYGSWSETLIDGTWECNQDSELEVYISTQ